jgi:hypothetical protein
MPDPRSSGAGAAPAGAQRVTAGMRWMLLAAGVLVFLAGVPLFIGTEQTDRYFAWTVRPPITAAFLGAAYWASCVLELGAAREATWVRARVAVPAVLIFTCLTLIVTLINLDRFHFFSSLPIARLVTWAWLAIYVAVPLMLGVLLVRQIRVPGADPPRTARPPGWMRATGWLQAAVLLIAGSLLLSNPGVASWMWPWMLTALTGRATGAWLIGLGVGVLHAGIENDLDRARVGFATFVAMGVLQLIALARYHEALLWARPVTWIYVLVVLSVLGMGLAGLLYGNRSRSARGS